MKKLINKHYLAIELAALFSFITMYILTFVFMDNDGWFILNNGRYIIEHGIPYKNPFTFLPDLDIIIQQWLWSVINYKVYELFGFIGIYVLCIIISIVAFLLLMKIGKLYQCHVGLLITLSSFGLMIISIFLNIRPTFITVVLLLWQIYIMEKYKITNNGKYLLFLPIISLLEINLHSAIWIFHFVFLLPYIVPPIKNPFVVFSEVKYSIKKILQVIPFMIAAGLINPYGVRGILYLFYSYGDQLKDAKIKELMPPATDNIGLCLLLIGSLLLVWIALNRKKRIDSSLFYILCGTGILSLSHTRNAVYFLLGSLLFSIFIIKDIDINFYKINKHSKAICYASTLFLLLVGVYSLNDRARDIRNQGENDSFMTPYAVMQYFEKENIDKNVKIYTGFNTGGYIEWNGYKSYMDPRPELYFKRLNNQFDYFKEYNQLLTMTDPQKIKSFIDKYDFDYMIVNKSERLNLYLEMSEHQKVVDGNSYFCYKIHKKD